MTATETALHTHRAAILSMLATLAGLMGVTAGGMVETVPRFVYRTALRLLRPAESAVRRLIVVWGQNLLRSVHTLPPQFFGGGVAGARGRGRGLPGFPLFDRMWQAEAPQRCSSGAPRILLFDGSAVATPPPELLPDDPVDAARLLRRMQAMRRALDDLPGHAERMAKALARRRAAPPGPGHRFSPVRRSRPPGHLVKPRHAIDRVLADCHYLACEALNGPRPTIPP